MDRCHCGDFKRERGCLCLKGIYAVASAMYTERRSLDAIAQNLANAQSAAIAGLKPCVRSAQTLATEGRNGNIAGDGGAGIHEGSSGVISPRENPAKPNAS